MKKNVHCLLVVIAQIILLLGLGIPSVWAHAPSVGAPFISNFDAKVYKADSQNWVSVQDARGVMYFGNSNGILEFDGQRWRLVETTATVRGLTIADDGTIFYGSIGDFGYLSVSPTGKLSTVSLRDLLPEEERSFNDVWQAESTPQGVYFLTRGRIFRFHQGKMTALAGKFAASQAVVLNGALLYADIDKGLCLIDGDQIHPLPQLTGLYDNKRITLARFAEHELLVGRISGDFRHVDLSPLWDPIAKRYDPTRAATVPVQPFVTELDHWLTEDQGFMYKLVPLGTDSFAISTLKAGILVFDRTGKLLRAINKNGGLADNTVGSLMVDRASNVWAATNSGISHIELSVPQSQFGVVNGIEGRALSAHYHQGRLYIGTYQNVYAQEPFVFDLKHDVPRFSPVKEGANQIWQLLEVDGDLLAATGRGLDLITADRAVHIAGSSANAYSLAVTPRWPGHVFVGLNGGLVVYKREATGWVFAGHVGDVKETIHQIVSDAQGDLWLATDVSGLRRTHFTGDKPTQIAVEPIGLENGLSQLDKNRLAFVDNTAYLLSPSGLARATVLPWRAQGSQPIRFKPDTDWGKSFNQPAVPLASMTPDGHGGQVIVGGDRVFWAKAQPDGTLRLQSAPFAGIDTISRAPYLHPQGGVWLLGDSVFRVNPWAPKNYQQSFDVLIRKVLTNGKQPAFEGAHANTANSPDQAQAVSQREQGEVDVPSFSYANNALTFEFAATFYEKPGSTQYQYQLEGFDPDWSEWSSTSTKEYTNLPEGRYQFKVRAKNLYGVLGREAVYALHIQPPWYRTWWAYLLWFALAAATLWIGVTFYTRHMRRENERLEQLVAERTQQLRDASLTDPLTGLRNRRFISEVLQSDVNAFVGYKNYLVEGRNNRASRSGEEVFGLFLLDMDHFKQVNDTYGHEAGDQVLKQFSTLLSKLVRQDDIVIRLGGEEFLVVLKQTLPSYLHQFAGKLLEKVAATEFDLGQGTRIRKTCSIGYVSFPLFTDLPNLFSFDQSVAVADMGMYYAKQTGRNRAVYLARGPQVPQGDDIISRAASSLDFAIKEGYLDVHVTRLDEDASEPTVR